VHGPPRTLGEVVAEDPREDLLAAAARTVALLEVARVEGHVGNGDVLSAGADFAGRRGLPVQHRTDLGVLEVLLGPYVFQAANA